MNVARRILRFLRATSFVYVGFLWTMLCFVLGMLCLIPAPRSGRIAHFVLRMWGRGTLALGGVGLRVEGPGTLKGHAVPRMIVANHASYLDPPALGAVFPGQLRFVLKQELMRLPFVGWYAKFAGHFLLDRGNPREGKRVLDRAIARAKRYGLCPLVFPEGTRTRDGKLAPLKTGAFQLALAPGIPVQPVAILHTYDLMPRGVTAPRRAGTVVVRVGEPIPVEGLKGSPGRKILAEKVRVALAELGVE